jgi:plasmid replication initiation protein
MEMPVFSFSTKPDMAVWNWASSDGKRAVEVTPSRLGRATMHDKDFIIFLISQVMADVNKGGVPQRRIQVRLTDFFSATGKTVNKRATRNTGSKDTYQLAEEALDRLKSTGIKVRTTNEAGGRRTDSISFIGDWSIVERSKGDGRATIIEVAVSDWMQRIVEEKTVLTISPDYFKLRKPLEKKLYEIARKHVGEKAKWKIGEIELKEKTGSRASMKEFRRMVRDICNADNIPDYRMTPSTKVTGEAAWIFYAKDDKKLIAKISKG